MQALFEYIFHHENSIREAMELAAQAVVATKYFGYNRRLMCLSCLISLSVQVPTQLIVNDTNYFLPLRYEDWWWKVALGKCYFRLGMLR